MRMRRMDDILHEGPAVTRLAVPGVAQHVAAVQRVREIHGVGLQQTVADSVDALEPKPSTASDFRGGGAEARDFGTIGALIREIGLNYAMVTAGLEELGALRVGGADIQPGLPGVDSDHMAVVMPVAADVVVLLAQQLQGPDRKVDLAFLDHVKEHVFETVLALPGHQQSAAAVGGGGRGGGIVPRHRLRHRAFDRGERE